MSEIDLQGCESCGTQVPIQDAVYSEGCHFCPECFAAWRAEFAACEHKWEPHVSEMGDEGFYCSRCAGFVATEDFPKLGLKLPEAA